uniref:Gamma-glutamyltransferase n=1 Tax=Glossina morsitans morsitans TaxID=37546 RepID=A0A1B0FNN7_GLOMM
MNSLYLDADAYGSGCDLISLVFKNTDGLKMVHSNDDAMNKIPLKSVTDDEEKNGGEFIQDTATAEEARREERRVKLLHWMKKFTIGIICFIGIALFCYVIISLCFSDWPKSTGTTSSTVTKTTTKSTTTNTSTSTNSNITTITTPQNYKQSTPTIVTLTTEPPSLSLPLSFNSTLLSSDDGSEQAASAATSSLQSGDNINNNASNIINSTLVAAVTDLSYNNNESTSDTQSTSPTTTSISTSSGGEATPSVPSPATTIVSETEIGSDTLSSSSPSSPATLTLKDIPITDEHYISKLGVYQNAAVCSDRHVCSKIGSHILQMDGSVVDATIAAMLCNGITTLHSMGIGGGMLMNIYIKERQQAFSVDAREVAPYAASQDMFNDKKNVSEYGALVIAVPGEIKGYHRAHEKFGKLPWKKLVEPSIKLCREGFYMNKHMMRSAKHRLNIIKENEILRKMLFNETADDIHPLGTKLQPLKELCKTYELLAENGPLDFYNGTLAKMVADDLEDLGSVVTSDDLESYRADMVSSITMQLGNDILYAVPPISSGTIVANILSILEGFNFTRNDLRDEQHEAYTIHRMVEAMKFSFAKRWELGDVRFNDVRELVSRLTNPETGMQMRALISNSSVLKNVYEYGAQFSGEDDAGTSHFFGSVHVGKRTGILFNSGMLDFSVPDRKDIFDLPASPTNFIDPQKRPMSSMSPMILTDDAGKVRMIIGAAGGSKIISAIVEVMARVLWFNQDIKEAIDAPRFHHQLVPNILQYEENRFSEELLNLLRNKGHKVEQYVGIGSVVCGIVRNETAIYANADFRKQGGTAGF